MSVNGEWNWFFDAAYCIHYPNDERRETIGKQFELVGLEPRYIHARKPWHKFNVTNMRRNPPIEFACNMSHIKAVIASCDDRNPIFFEDDVVFCDDWAARLNAVMNTIPYNWDVLYFGGHPREPTEFIGSDLYRVKTFSCAEAYAFNHGAQRRFVRFWCDRIGKENAMYDFILGEFAAENNAYAVYPTITSQVDGYSEIAGRIDIKGDLVERGWQNNT